MILVTGGAGFIGSNLVAALDQRSATPVFVCDSLDNEEKERNLAKHKVAGLIEPSQLLEWLDGPGKLTETIFHLGAISATTERDPVALLDNNVALSTSLWRWCSAQEARLIYASSAATYGDGLSGFDDDPDPRALAALKPLNGYGQSKQLFDIDAALMSRMGCRPTQWVGLKFFNVYGPNEYHKGGQRSVVVQLYEQISSTGQAKLFRSHHDDYKDGGQLRDFIWVGDCIEVMLWLYDNPGVSGIFNCGTGEARSFLDLARACFRAMEREESIEFMDTPEGLRARYQYYTEASMERLRDAGFMKPFTSLEDGVVRYIRNYLQTNDPYR
ncbi:MAG: ADP-L-glycero-D-manno-heptose-6-epimerase [Alphaproteobacteria bacterium MarineAlpha4_Bin2]|nr:MAG: ADP-L-glycero-D-manno-heptose-6-epimerase [Alphaproteobacteria bacterium MarineAlpha4_Bin2]